MTITINIQNVDETDFDDNPIVIRMASASIDGTAVKETFTYDAGVTDATINADVRAKLAARGYQFV